MKTNEHSILKAFEHAFNGMYYFFLHERNGRIEIGIAAATVGLALLMGVSITEWTTILLCIALVIGFELVNSALEKLCDGVQEEYHPVIKTVKDMTAAAVLWCAIISVIVGMIIFLPKLFQF